MSDKPKKEEAKKEGAEEHGDSAAKKGGIGALLTKLPVLLGGVMVIEAGVLFGAFKMLGSSPPPAEGAALTDKDGDGHDSSGLGALVEDPHAAGGDAHGGAAKPDPNAIKVYANGRYSMPVIEFRAPNKTSGKMLIFDVAVEVQVKGTNYYHVTEQLKQRKALISDRIRTIIAQSDPEKLNGQAEPGLETLKRQIKKALEDIVGANAGGHGKSSGGGDHGGGHGGDSHGVIEEVLVPRCIPFRADF